MRLLKIGEMQQEKLIRSLLNTAEKCLGNSVQQPNWEKQYTNAINAVDINSPKISTEGRRR